ncbi:hypothetical protein [Selenihalanaerobacter shriftii]|uniref:Predicted nucleotide-binding protein, sugar kinase/HSP70/actin superfamily n=1 Tax=Selenihalanaerobacter shriftii TaxID=142842 RepID=A0A1T4L2A9_9FIRM|nr:hypothetical protein [Selenihalanaerobacter shriftii]SJZ48731.1 Predicted nucleotide-binding protein, sugar kinase/HSP70/actin superfamily [Selenihalanaerobacter shriftii]
MKVTFPQMGSLSIPLQSFLRDLKIDMIVPPPLTKRTLNLGTKYSPESACLPFKFVLGNFIEALDLGADALIIAGGNGPCRFGHFGELANDILKDLGYDFEIYILEPPISSIIEVFRTLSSDFSLIKAGFVLRLAWAKLILLEELKKFKLMESAYLSKGVSQRLDNKYLELILKAKGHKELSRIKEKFKIELLEIRPQQPNNLLRIGIVGDIYTVSESFANLDVERRLNELGVKIDRAVFLSKWVKNNLIFGALGLTSNRQVINAAKDYLKEGVGGLGLETIGETVLYGEKDYDGVIQLAPFGCMPEIIAKSLFTKIEENLEIPILTLILDEHSSATGVQTRLEAFVDLLQQKKKNPKTFLA